MSEELLDEITSINSIYGDDTLTATAEDSRIYALTLPIRSNISLRTEFPADYPDAPPSILGTQHIGDNVAKGEGQQIVDCIRAVLAEIYIPGSPCIFDLIEEGGQKLQQLGLDAGGAREEEQQASQANGQDHDQYGGQESYSDEHQSLDDLGDAPHWVLSDVVTEKKSVFLARAAEVHSVDEAKTYLAHLLGTDKKAAKATHNITAWRIQGENGVQFQETHTVPPPYASDPCTIGLHFQVPLQSRLHFVLVITLSKLYSLAKGKEEPSKLFNIFRILWLFSLPPGCLPF